MQQGKRCAASVRRRTSRTSLLRILGGFLWRERGDDLVKTRVAAERQKPRSNKECWRYMVDEHFGVTNNVDKQDVSDFELHVGGMLRPHKIFFYPKIQALTSRITRR